MVAVERELLMDTAEEPLVRLLNASSVKRLIAQAVACGLLLLAGCHLPKLALPKCGPALPADYNGKTSPEDSAQLSVEEFFGDPVLTSLIGQALGSNQELSILNQEVRLASYEVLARRGAYLPFASFRADAGIDKHSLYTPEGAAEEQLLTPGGDHFPDPLPNFLVGFDFLWRIDIWRELRNARAAAAQRYYAAIERRNYFVTELVADIAENYYELLALDNRQQVLNRIIGFQQQSLKFAEANMQAGRASALPVQRFLAEVRKNQSELLIVRQEIIEAENRINFLAGRYPQPVELANVDFINLNLPALAVGVPSQLLLYRRDIQQAEREMAAAGLDVQVARARFFPRLDITGTVGWEAFNTRYLFRPEALVIDVAGGLVAPLINRTAIRADYLSANARQLQAVYNYQRVVLNAFTEVVNSLSRVENYGRSIDFKRGQLASLEGAVVTASGLYQSARAEYVEVLLAQRDLLDARTVLIETKQQQLAAIVSAYQALGGGTWLANSPQNTAGLDNPPPPQPQPEPEPIEAPPPDPLPDQADRREAPLTHGETVRHAVSEGLHSDHPVIHLAGVEMNAVELPPIILRLPTVPTVEAGVGSPARLPEEIQSEARRVVPSS
jgi:NodT family efflux transporter outer membrane factor (OMF) lipoprotein